MIISFRLEIVIILTQDSCMVCANRTTGSEIILDAPDGTCNTPGVIVLINLPCHHNALQSIHD
jgi:hypothetical protein